MIYSQFYRPCVLFVAVLLFGLTSCTEQPISHRHDESNIATIDHQAWQNLLDEYLIDDDASGVNLVDYQSLSEEALPELADYVDSMAAIDIGQYRRAEQFAYWVNLYNAITVQLVAEHYPVNSIKDISEEVLSLGPWDDVVIEIGDSKLTLNDIEHQILRKNWQEYRVHFAVNCASISCPNLLTTAFTSDNTEGLLSQAAASYLQHPRGFEMVDGVLKLSSIFDWYQEDFGKNEKELLITLSKHLSPEKKQLLANFGGEIEYHYDWAINSVD